MATPYLSLINKVYHNPIGLPRLETQRNSQVRDRIMIRFHSRLNRLKLFLYDSIHGIPGQIHYFYNLLIKLLPSFESYTFTIIYEHITLLTFHTKKSRHFYFVKTFARFSVWHKNSKLTDITLPKLEAQFIAKIWHYFCDECDLKVNIRFNRVYQ